MRQSYQATIEFQSISTTPGTVLPAGSSYSYLFLLTGRTPPNTLPSSFACFMYVYETYQTGSGGWTTVVETLLGMYFLFDYFLRIYISDHWCRVSRSWGG